MCPLYIRYNYLTSNDYIIRVPNPTYLGEIGIDKSLFKSDEQRQWSDELKFGVTECIADGRKRPGAVRFSFFRCGRVHE